MNLIPGVPDLPETLSVPSFHVEPRCHDDRHVALWQVRGSSECTCHGRKNPLKLSDILWIPAGTWHEIEVHPNSVLLPLFFATDAAAPLTDQVTTLHLQHSETGLLLTKFQQQSTIIRPEPDLDNRVLSILRRTLTKPYDLNIPTSTAASAVAYSLLANPGDRRSISQWALTTHVSARSIERCFKTETGKTFQEWRNQCRMQAASQMLCENMTISAVSSRLGFRSPSSFSRAFKLFHGRSPKEYLEHDAEQPLGA